MSLKSSLFAVALVILLLLPTGRVLRDQSPFTCFGFTYDEGFFAQAASHWSEGKGYRIAEGTPFDPSITVGLPMAWGAAAVQSLTGKDIETSGRFFVFGCYLLLLFTLARSAYRIDRNGLAILTTLGIFGYGFSKIPFGPYFAFGFLGEMPGFLLGALAYRALDEKRFIRAGLLAVGVFVMKPTFLFFLPAVGVAALLHSSKATVRTGLAMLLGLGLLFFGISQARNQSIADYLFLFFKESTRIARFAPMGSPLDLYKGIETLPSILSLLFLGGGALSVVRSRRMSPSITAAFFLFASTAIYYGILGQRPVEKQWSAVFVLTLIGFAVPWGSAIAGRFQGWIPRETIRVLILAVSATAIFSVGHDVMHRYKRTPETACPSKEQTAINTKVRALADKGELTRENFGAWTEAQENMWSIYRLSWPIEYQRNRQAFGPTLPKWLYGESKNLFPLPDGCKPEFHGETFALLRCEKTAPVHPPVTPRPKKRT